MQGGKSAAPNCRFDGSVAVYASLAASCRQCGNFCMPGTLAEIVSPFLRIKSALRKEE
jgi:hypothetical protein